MLKLKTKQTQSNTSHLKIYWKKNPLRDEHENQITEDT